jgi:hypothetical protein
VNGTRRSRHLNLTTWSNRTGTPFWVHCAAELCLIWIKAAPLRSAVGPASAPGSALGGPLGARRATHRRDPQTKVAQRATTECSDEPSSPGSRLSRSRHRVNGSPTGLSHAPCSTARSRRSLSGIRALPRTRGCRPRTPRPWARPPLVFDHPAACAERAIPSMKPAWGHPHPRFRLATWPTTTRSTRPGKCATGLPHSRRPAIMDRLRMASSPSVPAEQPRVVKVPGQRTREDRLDSLLQLTCLAAIGEWGRSGRTYRPGHRPARDAGTARSDHPYSPVVLGSSVLPHHVGLARSRCTPRFYSHLFQSGCNATAMARRRLMASKRRLKKQWRSGHAVAARRNVYRELQLRCGLPLWRISVRSTRRP